MKKISSVPKQKIWRDRRRIEGCQAVRILSRKEQVKVAQWLGDFEEDSVILQRIQNDFGKSFSQSGLDNYRTNKRWKKVVEFFRNRAFRKLGDVPIANKRVRLQRLEKIFQSALAHFEYMPTAKADALAALREARREMEGDRPISFFQQNIDARRFNQVQVTNFIEAAKLAYERAKAAPPASRLLDLSTSAQPEPEISNNGSGNGNGAHVG